VHAHKLVCRQRQSRLHRLAAQAVPAAAGPPSAEVDVVVVGSGIIGLLITRQILISDQQLSVALFDAQQPCAGATGAGEISQNLAGPAEADAVCAYTASGT
jgi:NADPH-dependent 2,4-dienoyl-CoA reductase/sulfur reductase-like enzyme